MIPILVLNATSTSKICTHVSVSLSPYFFFFWFQYEIGKVVPRGTSDWIQSARE
jgi:hypothetical protein